MMSDKNETTLCRTLIDHQRYPIDNLEHPERRCVIKECRKALAGDGCAVLNGFISPSGLERLLTEVEERKPLAYFSKSKKTNVYFSSDDPSLPPDHPQRIFLERTNGFVTSDHFDDNTAARRLYYWPPLTQFIADCLGKETLYIYDDPVSNMIVNVGKPGSCFNWHFDTNEFTITMLLKPAASGGHFEYVPNLRSAEDENYEAVSRVLKGDDTQTVRLDLNPGDLQLFLGRFSLHRVTENTGETDRLLLIMSFAERPGMIGSQYRIQELYGKVTDAHIAAERNRIRNDGLMD
ncbi:MAG: hypothetical protein E2O37_10160 [Proteobacteria bacterium]|nr:MAG: hypothetical protein E2O37_10160 [Pseudomonadota bacterium]TDJ71352.1 MAG: hypothetical protein E2O38_08095 [Pseudomonadota bacterium]